MIAENLYYLMLVLFSTGVISVFATKDNVKITNYVAHSMALMGCTLGILCAIFVFIQGKINVVLPIALPVGPILGSIDYLSAFFLMIVGVVGLGTSIYAYGYTQEYYHCRLPLLASLYNAFLLSMVLVITVSNVIAFVIAWEMMSVISFFLVNHEYDKKVNTRSAYIYIVMTHIGTVFIIIAFLLLAVGAGSLDFSQLKGSLVSETRRNVIFLCILVGFGTKAGMVPVHIWLPRAHPAAPSHISALMSGVMLKTAIYGMCRFFFDFLGTGPIWWGVVILVVGIVTALIGALYAFIEHDFKRLLAYSSIENMGIILIGIGGGLVFVSNQELVFAGVAFSAALYHSFNHALFKSLAFMGAGAVLRVTHTKNIEELGGLIKRMPYTAICCLIAAVAVAALPPLNGFVSEWLTFQSLLFLPQVLSGLTGKVFCALLIALLGLTGALAAACFVEAFGITFLAKPRSKQAAEAVEAPLPMLIGMGIMGILCIVVGVFPKLMLTIISLTLMSSSGSGINVRGLVSDDWYALGFTTGQSSGEFSTITTLLLLSAGGLLAWLLYSALGKEKVTVGETWTCGIVPDFHMEYTATGFSKSIRMVFKSIVHAHSEVLLNANEHKYHGQKLSYQVRIQYLFVSVLYGPIQAGIMKGAKFMKSIQAGSVQLYVGYIMAVTVIVLIWSIGW